MRRYIVSVALLMLSIAKNVPAQDCPLLIAPPSDTMLHGPNPSDERRRSFFAVSVTPDNGSEQRYLFTNGHAFDFTVSNTGDCDDYYTIGVVGGGSVTSASVNPTSVWLAAGTYTTVTLTYSVGAAGSGTASVTAWGTGVNDNGGLYVNVVAPPGAPVVDATPYNFDKQDYGRCAAGCFAAIHSQTTVPYFSLDAPRSVTLNYNGDRVNPKPFIHVNVTPDVGYGQTPLRYELRIKISDVQRTFVNGDSVLRFAYLGTAALRIGGQFDASSFSTGMYKLHILVTAVYSSGSISNVIDTKLMVVNETTSPIARGWTVAGVQRLYVHGDSALITEGDGSAVYFKKDWSGFASPAGEFSQLVNGMPGGGSGWTRRYPDSTKAVFNSAGRMTELRDRFNNIITVTYDGANRISKIKDPLNIPITLAYDANGLDYIADSLGRMTQITVDVSKRLTLFRDPDLIGTTFGYDGTLRLSTITNRRGFTTTLGYDAQSGGLLTITPPAVQVVNDDGSLATASPITTLESWQKKGVPYVPTGTPVTAPQADTIYARVLDPSGHISRFTVNRWGAPRQATDALGRTIATAYDGQGLAVRVDYPTGVKDTFAYNTSGLPTYSKPSGRDSAIYIRYGAWAQPDSVWGFQVPPLRSFIGANGRVDSTRTWGSAGAAVTRYVYETRGRIERITDALNHLGGRTWFTGTNGNRSKDSLPGGRVSTYAYDTYGRQTSVSAPGVNQRFTAYDLLNRVLKDSIFGMPPTVYAYDSLFLKTVTDPKGQLYRFAYNALGWTTARTDPANHADTLRYDRHGLVRIWKNRRFEVIRSYYDAGHRAVAKGGTNTDSVTWAYPSDTVVTATNPWATDTQFFSRTGQLDSIRTKLSNQTFTQRFRYTVGGQLDSVTVAGGGITFLPRKYFWNAQTGKLASIRLGGGGSTMLSRNADVQLSAATLPGGDQVTHAYTSLHADAQVSTTAGYAPVITRYVGFDIAGRISRQIYGDGVNGWEFSYDVLGRLTTANPITVSNPQPPEGCGGTEIVNENGQSCVEGSNWVVVPGGSTFSYDSVGNRRDQAGDYGPGNRIRAFANCTYVTDSLGDGNVLSRTCGTDVVRFHWSPESRLVALKVVNGDSLEMRYDAAGRLVRRHRIGATPHFFLWQGDNLLAELDSVTGKVAEYSYYPGLDNPHAVITGTTPYFAHADGIGNVIALTDSAAPSAERSYDYGAWGLLTGGTDTKPFNNVDRARFKGALWLGPEVDLYYMRARWYEPKSGRFLSEDPIGIAGGINPYIFAADDPVNGRDPTGMLACRDGVTVIIDNVPVACTQELLDMVDSWLGGYHGLGLDDAWRIGGYTSYYADGRRKTHCPEDFRGARGPSPLCEILAYGIAFLLQWGNEAAWCFDLGLNALGRMARGQYRRTTGFMWHSGEKYVGHTYEYGDRAVITISSQAFVGWNIPNVMAHEEFHATNRGNLPHEEPTAGRRGDFCGRGLRELPGR